MILKKSLSTDLENRFLKNLRKAIMFFGKACIGLVYRSTANQHFLRSAPDNAVFHQGLHCRGKKDLQTKEYNIFLKV